MSEIAKHWIDGEWVGSDTVSPSSPPLPERYWSDGKTPMIVSDNADLDTTVSLLAAAVTTFAGQFCMTGSRILVQRGVADEVRTRLAGMLQSVRLGCSSSRTATPPQPASATTALDRPDGGRRRALRCLTLSSTDCAPAWVRHRAGAQ